MAPSCKHEWSESGRRAKNLATARPGSYLFKLYELPEPLAAGR